MAWTIRVHKISDDLHEQVLKAVESGMTCRQAAAHCGVSLASAIRFAKRAGLTDKRFKAKRDARAQIREQALKAIEGGMSGRQAAAHFCISQTSVQAWIAQAGVTVLRASPKRIGDDVRDKVFKAVEGGMTCRQAAALAGVSVASAIRWTKILRAPLKS
jgi:transposase